MSAYANKYFPEVPHILTSRSNFTLLVPEDVISFEEASKYHWTPILHDLRKGDSGYCYIEFEAKLSPPVGAKPAHGVRFLTGPHNPRFGEIKFTLKPSFVYPKWIRLRHGANIELTRHANGAPDKMLVMIHKDTPDSSFPAIKYRTGQRPKIHPEKIGGITPRPHLRIVPGHKPKPKADHEPTTPLTDDEIYDNAEREGEAKEAAIIRHTPQVAKAWRYVHILNDMLLEGLLPPGSSFKRFDDNSNLINFLVPPMDEWGGKKKPKA